MDEEDLEKYAEESVKNGYSKDELENVLTEEGFDENEIEKALSEIDESKLGQSLGNPISGLELNDNKYSIVQNLVRNKYRVFNSDNELVLKASQKLFRAKESFDFRNSDGKAVFSIDAEKVLDFSGDYTLRDAENEEAFAVLEKEFTLFQHSWKVKTPEGENAASITSRSSILDFLRSFSDMISIIPHKYSIESPEGKKIGEIKGELGLKDRYTIIIEESEDIPKEALIASAISADALE